MLELTRWDLLNPASELELLANRFYSLAEWYQSLVMINAQPRYQTSNNRQ